MNSPKKRITRPSKPLTEEMKREIEAINNSSLSDRVKNSLIEGITGEAYGPFDTPEDAMSHLFAELDAEDDSSEPTTEVLTEDKMDFSTAIDQLNKSYPPRQI